MKRLIILSLLSSSVLAADDWVMAMHDSQHTGTTSEIVYGPLTLAWKWVNKNNYDNCISNPGIVGCPLPTVGAASSFYLQPIAYQGFIYAQGGVNGNILFRFDPATHAAIEWGTNGCCTRNGSTLYHFLSYPAAISNRIMWISSDSLASVPVSTGGGGASLYMPIGGAEYGSIAVNGSLAYATYVLADLPQGEEFNILSDLTLASGIKGIVGGYPGVVGTYAQLFRVPAVDLNVVYVDFQGLLTAYNATTRAVLWTYAGGGTGFNRGRSPATANGVVYFHNYDGTVTGMQALKYVDGAVTRLWSVANSSAAGVNPIVSDGMLYWSDTAGVVHGVDTATGGSVRQWSFTLTTPFTEWQLPAISGNTIFVPGTDNKLYLLDKNTGALLSYYQGTAPWGSIIISNKMVYASDKTGALYAFYTGSGAASSLIVQNRTVLQNGSPEVR